MRKQSAPMSQRSREKHKKMRDISTTIELLLTLSVPPTTHERVLNAIRGPKPRREPADACNLSLLFLRSRSSACMSRAIPEIRVPSALQLPTQLTSSGSGGCGRSRTELRFVAKGPRPLLFNTFPYLLILFRREEAQILDDKAKRRKR